MWFVGGIVGLLFGSIVGSGFAAFIFAIIGSIGGHFLFRSQKGDAADTARAAERARNTSKPYAPDNDDTPDDKFVTASALNVLRTQVSQLNARVQALEQQLGLNKQSTQASQAAAAMPSPSTTATVAVPIAGGTPGWVVPEPSASTKPLPPPVQSPQPAQPKSAVTADLNDGLWTDTKPGPISAANTSGGAAPTRASVPSPAPVRPPAPPPVPLKDRLPAPIAALIFGGNTIVKMGVLILFLGLAFLLRYTAERVAIPLELRYAGVALVGAGLLALGWFLRTKRRDYALILQGAGIGVFYLTILAAMKMHTLLPSTMGFTFMFAVSVLGAVLAILQNAPLLAIVSVLEGFAAPILASTGQNRPLGLFTYLSVLNIGVFVMAWFKAWRVLNLIAFVGTFVLASGWAQKYYTNEQYAIAQPFLVFFFVLFSCMGLLFARRTLMDTQAETAVGKALNAGLAQRAGTALRQVGRVDSALVFGVPLTAFGLQYQLSKPWEYGPAIAALLFSAFYLFLGRAVFSRERPGLGLLAEAYAVVGVIFLTLAIPLALEGQWTGAAWAIEAAGMYWLGSRQQRPYARAFAFVVLAGAAFKLLQDTRLGGATDATVLLGTTIGPALLALAVFAVWWMHLRSKDENRLAWEALPAPLLPWLGMAALTMLPWQWFMPIWAAAATAGLALAAYIVTTRFAIPGFGPIVGAMQALAVVGFMLNLHVAAPGANAALSNGLQGMFSAAIISLSVLCTAGWSMAAVRRAAIRNNTPPNWSTANAVAVVVGVGLLHLAMLFGASLVQAAWIWPVTGLLVLWVALRMSHTPLAAFAMGLQVASAVLYMWATPHANRGLAGFTHLGFVTPLVLALASWVAGDWVRAQAQRLVPAEKGKESAQSLWVNHWCGKPVWQWVPVLWGLAAWLFAWMGESSRVLQIAGLPHNVLAASVVIVLLTSVAMLALAHWRSWEQMAQTTVATLPAWVGLAVLGLTRHGGNALYLPSANWGWLAWPAAFAWHFALLRIQTRWLSETTRKYLHVLGFWFFLLLATRECQWHFASVSDAGSSWQLLGMVLLPAWVLWRLGTPRLARLWPLTEFRASYLHIACLPVALYLLVWVWVSNLTSPGNAIPLSYLPLLNPLELAHWLVLAAVLLWWRSLPNTAAPALPVNIAAAIAAITALALVTGMVLRTCHHWAGVPWNLHGMYASWLVQAALSITWGLCGVAGMVFAHRTGQRVVWVAGAALLGIVVLKLFFVELANQGGLFRIVSFIAVGALLLLVGYFAPVPPNQPSQKEAS